MLEGLGTAAAPGVAPKKRGVNSVIVDSPLCKACGICVELCPRAAVFDSSPDGTPVVARLEDCNGCRSCELHCPDFAIRITLSTDQAAPLEEEVA